MKEKIISLAISLGLMTTIGFKDLSYADTTVSGIVTATALNVRSGPATTYSVIGQVLQGNDIKIVDKTGNWLKVNYKNTMEIMLMYRQVICRTHQAKTKETQEVITLVMGIICQTEVQKTTIHKLLLKIQVQLLPIVLMLDNSQVHHRRF